MVAGAADAEGRRTRLHCERDHSHDDHQGHDHTDDESGTAAALGLLRLGRRRTLVDEGAEHLGGPGGVVVAFRGLRGVRHVA